MGLGSRAPPGYATIGTSTARRPLLSRSPSLDREDDRVSQSKVIKRLGPIYVPAVGGEVPQNHDAANGLGGLPRDHALPQGYVNKPATRELLRAGHLGLLHPAPERLLDLRVRGQDGRSRVLLDRFGERRNQRLADPDSGVECVTGPRSKARMRDRRSGGECRRRRERDAWLRLLGVEFGLDAEALGLPKRAPGDPGWARGT